MKVILITTLAIFMAGCGTLSVDTTDDNGRDWHITGTALFTKIADLNAKVGDVEFSIGGISSELTAEDIAAYLRVMNAVQVPDK